MKGEYIGQDGREGFEAYASIVERVAETEPYDPEYEVCLYCDAPVSIELKSRDNPIRRDHTIHASDCPYLAARKIRGKE